MLHVFAGDDTFRSRQAYRAARAEAVQTSSVTILRDDLLTIDRLATATSGQSLFGGATTVAVEELTQFTGDRADRIVEILASIPKETRVLMWEPGAPAERLKVWKALRVHADAFEVFAPLSESERIAWVEERVRTEGGSIPRSVTQVLIRTAGADLWRLSHEIEKLVLYAHGRPITAEDIGAVVASVVEVNSFRTVRALAGGKGAEALQELARHRARGDDARMLVSLTLREARLLLVVRDLLDRRQPVTPWSLARDLHIPSSAAQALIASARATTTTQARALFERLAVGIYALNTGRAEPEDLLDTLAFRTIVRSS